METWDNIKDLSSDEQGILLHSLGINDLRWYDKDKLKKEPFRNYFYTSKTSHDYLAIKALIDKGLMIATNKSWDGESFYFLATREGIKVAYSIAKTLLKETMPTRSQRRYEAYRRSETDETFFEWLTNHYWDDYRKRLRV